MGHMEIHTNEKPCEYQFCVCCSAEKCSLSEDCGTNTKEEHSKEYNSFNNSTIIAHVEIDTEMKHFTGS